MSLIILEHSGHCSAESKLSGRSVPPSKRTRSNSPRWMADWMAWPLANAQSISGGAVQHLNRSLFEQTKGQTSHEQIYCLSLFWWTLPTFWHPGISRKNTFVDRVLIVNTDVQKSCILRFFSLPQGRFTLNLLLKTAQHFTILHFSPILSPGSHCPWLHRSWSCQEHQKQSGPQYLESKWGRPALATWLTKPDVLDAPWHLRFLAGDCLRWFWILDGGFCGGKEWGFPQSRFEFETLRCAPAANQAPSPKHKARAMGTIKMRCSWKLLDFVWATTCRPCTASCNETQDNSACVRPIHFQNAQDTGASLVCFL